MQRDAVTLEKQKTWESQQRVTALGGSIKAERSQRKECFPGSTPG